MVRRSGETIEIPLPDPDPASQAREEFVRSFGFVSGQTNLVSPMPGDVPSGARDAGITDGSVILEIDGSPIEDWDSIVASVRKAGERDGKARVRWRTHAGDERSAEVKLTRVSSSATLGIGAPLRWETVQEENIVAAAALGLDRTQRWVMRILNSLGSIVRGRAQ